MINQLIASVIIEAKTGSHDMARAFLKSYAEDLRDERNNSPYEDAEGKATLKTKEDLIWQLMDGLEVEFESHIEAVKERYPCLKESDISTGYLQSLPNGWTQS